MSHLRQPEACVLIYEVERKFIGGGLEGQHYVIPCTRKVSAYYNQFRIENVYKECNALANFFAGFLYEFYRQRIVFFCCVDNVVDMYCFTVVVFFAQNGIDTFFDTLHHLVFDSDTRNFCLETAFFAAGADDFVVVEWRVSEFASETALSVVQFAVHNHADGHAASEVKVEYVLFALDVVAGEVFGIASCSGVVFEKYLKAGLFFDYLGKRVFGIGEVFLSASGIGIYATRNADPHTEDLVLVDAAACEELVYG